MVFMRSSKRTSYSPLLVQEDHLVGREPRAPAPRAGRARRAGGGRRRPSLSSLVRASSQARRLSPGLRAFPSSKSLSTFAMNLLDLVRGHRGAARPGRGTPSETGHDPLAFHPPCPGGPGGRAGSSAPSRGWGSPAAPASPPAGRWRSSRRDMPTRLPMNVGCSPRWRDMANIVLAVRMASSKRPRATSARNRTLRALARGGVCLHVGDQQVDAVGLQLQQDLPVGVVEPGRPVGLGQREAAVIVQLPRGQFLERHGPAASRGAGMTPCRRRISAAP